MVSYNCPKCGHYLDGYTMYSYPIICEVFCPFCGWRYSTQEKNEKMIRYKENDNNKGE